MSGVRRLPLGVRACDRQGCWHPWPCPTHGTLVAQGSAVPDSAVAAATLTALRGVRRAVGDFATCCGCGYHVCACARRSVAPALDARPGWGRATGSCMDVTDDPRTWVPGVTRLRSRENVSPFMCRGDMATYVRMGNDAPDNETVYVVMDGIGIERCFFATRWDVVRDA